MCIILSEFVSESSITFGYQKQHIKIQVVRAPGTAALNVCIKNFLVLLVSRGSSSALSYITDFSNSSRFLTGFGAMRPFKLSLPNDSNQCHCCKEPWSSTFLLIGCLFSLITCVYPKPKQAWKWMLLASWSSWFTFTHNLSGTHTWHAITICRLLAL